MHVSSLHLQNFKHFTNLKIESIPETAKLILLMGANRSGETYGLGADLKFFGRSSLRVIPMIERSRSNADEISRGNRDRPERFILEDRRFIADLAAFTSRIDKALREPTFLGQARILWPFSGSTSNPSMIP